MTSTPTSEYGQEREIVVNGAIPWTAYWNIIMVRRWVVFLAIFLGILGAFVYLRVRKPEQYPFITVVEVGSRSDGEALEPMSTVVAKVKDGLTPKILASYAAEQGQCPGCDFDISSPKGSNVVVIKTSGFATDGDKILLVEQRIADALTEDHRRMGDVMHGSLESERLRAAHALDGLKGEAKLFPAHRQRIAAMASLLNDQAENLRAKIEDSRRQRVAVLSAEAARAASEASLATAVLVIDTELQHQSERLAIIEERLQVGVKMQEEALEKVIFENRRAQADQETVIADTQLKIEALRPSKVIVPPIRQDALPRYSLFRVFATALIIGVCAGALLAFMAEFMARARRERWAVVH